MATESGGIAGNLPGACLACGALRGIRDASGWACATCGWRYGDVPDAELSPPPVHVVYYLRFGDRIKIGTSARPRSRLAQLRYDELLAFERGGRSLEQQRHREFAGQRFPGSEWFHVNDELLAHIRVLQRDGIDPWDRYKRWRSEELAKLL
jgi:hypothetical protein